MVVVVTGEGVRERERAIDGVLCVWEEGGVSGSRRTAMCDKPAHTSALSCCILPAARSSFRASPVHAEHRRPLNHTGQQRAREMPMTTASSAEWVRRECGWRLAGGLDV